MLAQLFEVVLLERAPLAEEHSVRGGLGMRLVFERRELERADVIRKLEEAVVGRLCVAVNNGIPRQRVLNRVMKGVGDDGLTVVVIDLDLLELLEEVEVVEDCQNKVSLHAGKEAPVVGIFAFSVGEGHVLEGEFVGHHAEAVEEGLACRYPEAFVIIVAIEQWPQMHRDVRDPSGTKIGFVGLKDLVNILGLIV